MHGYVSARATIGPTSYAIYVGRDRSADGVGYLAGYGDEPSGHWLEVVGRAEHAPVGPVAAPLTPFFIGVESIPPEFRRHR